MTISLQPRFRSDESNHDGKNRAASRSTSNGRQPSYAGLFRCIGPQCEDTCCGDWDIPVDRITYQEYRRFPAEKLGSLVAHFVSVSAEKTHDNLYASIRRKQDGSCPFFGEDRLCGIQREYGAKLLTSTCSIYPRALALVNGSLEGSLSLSCPEAARAVLLEGGATDRQADLFSGEFRTDNVFGVRQHSGLEGSFLPVRTLITALIRDGSRPVWQRLLIIASLCSRLDDVAAGNLHSTSPLLDRYQRALGQGASAKLDRLEPRIATRLALAVTLSDQRCRDRDCGQRFRDVFWDFVEGIGTSGGEGLVKDVDRYRNAKRNYLDPYLSRFPFIAENYLLNYVYQHLFPFGRTGSNRFIAHSMFDEAVLLATQFSWLTTILTGVAGRYGPEFSHTQLITTVQSFTRAVEHAPQIQEDALAFVKDRDLDTLAGLAELLRT